MIGATCSCQVGEVVTEVGGDFEGREGSQATKVNAAASAQDPDELRKRADQVDRRPFIGSWLITGAITYSYFQSYPGFHKHSIGQYGIGLKWAERDIPEDVEHHVV